MKLCMVVGTRPEIIKMSPLITSCMEGGIDFFLLHTGQHYSYVMDAVFFNDLEIPLPRYNLSVGSSEYRTQVGHIRSEISSILAREQPDYLLVLGDTTSVVAGALASSELGIPIVHIEAGLRSHDLKMVEEMNRIITDHLSALLFAPTDMSLKLLLDERIDPERIVVCGNIIMEVVARNLILADKHPLVHKPRSYFLMTLHRSENVDDELRLREIIEAMDAVSTEYGMPILFAMHPRTKKMVEAFSLRMPETVCVIEPMGYIDFFNHLRHARMVLTDSGGIQEESAILRVPCVTMRTSTERPETVVIKANVLAGVKKEGILAGVAALMPSACTWKHPYGDGTTSKVILEKLKQHYEAADWRLRQEDGRMVRELLE